MKFQYMVTESTRTGEIVDPPESDGMPWVLESTLSTFREWAHEVVVSFVWKREVVEEIDLLSVEEDEP